MLIVISPAKKLDTDTPSPLPQYHAAPELLTEAEQLIATLRQLSVDDIAERMKLSMKLAQLNFERYASWSPPFRYPDSKPALLTFKGDVYTSLNVAQLTPADLAYSQDHLRILSGLYGLLRPFDLIHPYRLEMGTSLPTPRGKNLYQFWGDRITTLINRELAKQAQPVLINLASQEYWKVIQPQQIEGTLITPQFKQCREGHCRTIGIHAKRARGLMSRYILLNRLKTPQQLQQFNSDDYHYSAALSSANEWIFCRDIDG
ncbi:peroxide stress protein YaaA [Ectothiorhodospiraceae bacterium BW-2]|nr:peroxide stress protein YaaA [Ectothiorhodospiraceae bacterium BW-2]